MIDKNLNYGRENIEMFLKKSGDFKKVVDLGAGYGHDLLIAKRINPTSELHAVEVHSPYIKILQENAINVHPINIEKDTLPFESNSVDIIIMNQILEHVKEVFWIMHEIARVLKVGGSFIIGVPNIAALHNRLLMILGKQPTPLKNYSAHVRGWTKDDILKFFKECFGGFELKDFKGSNFYPFPPFIAKPLSRIFPNLSWSVFLLLKKTKEYEKQFLEYPVNKMLETNFYLGENSEKGS